MLPISGKHQYLQNVRKIDAITLNDARFSAQIRVDSQGNAIFPHFDRDGITGYEIKNKGFTGFAVGGEKGLWHSSNLGTASRIVIVESAIDGLSHAQIKRAPEAGYVSVGGALSDKQRDLVAGLLEKALERGAVVVLATDKDQAGHDLAEQIQKLAPDGLRIERQEPVHGKDWNDELKHEREHSYSAEM
jgi:5S rRNA maturation endonuclease (ribonuclease M5)